MARKTVDRRPESLALYAGRLTLTLLGIVGVAMAVVGIYAVNRGEDEFLEYLSAGIGILLVLVAAFLATSTNPVLIVDARGIRAPLMRHHEVLGWGRVAKVRVGSAWAQNALDVYTWRDINNQTPEGGVEWALHIPGALLPVRAKMLVAEIESYQPEVSTPDASVRSDQERRPPRAP